MADTVKCVGVFNPLKEIPLLTEEGGKGCMALFAGKIRSTLSILLSRTGQSLRNQPAGGTDLFKPTKSR